MKLSELIHKLSAIQETHGDCHVFTAFARHSSQFGLDQVAHVQKDDPAWEPPPHQSWLPARVVLTMKMA